MLKKTNKLINKRIKIYYIADRYYQYLNNEKIMNEGMNLLFNLRELNLCLNKKITDKGIKNLSKLKRIYILFSKISKEMKDKLKKKGCEIIG